MATDALSLLFKIKADSSDAQSGIKKLRNVFDSEVKGITGHTSSFGKLGESIGLSTTQMAGLARAAPIAGAAFAGSMAVIVGAVGAAAVAIFNLAQKSAEFGSEIFDASQKVSLSAETLSAIKVAADQSGASLGEFTQGFVRFERALTDAAGTNKKLAKTFTDLGVDVEKGLRDPEEAFKQFIANFNKLEGDAAKTTVATDLFGKSGANLKGTFETVGASLDVYIEKQRALGLVMSQEGVEAADKFGDQLTELGLVADGVGRIFAAEFMPAITGAMADIESALVSNQDTWREWGAAVATTIRGLRAIWRSAAEQAQALLMYGPVLGAFRAAAIQAETKGEIEREDAQRALAGLGGRARGIRERAGAGGGGGERGGGGGKKAGETDDERALKVLKQYQEQLANLTPRTEAQKAAEKLRTEGMRNATQATKDLVMQAAEDYDAKKKQLEVTKELEKAQEKAQELFKTFYIKQLQDLRAAQGLPGPNASDELDELVDRMSLLGQKMEPGLLALMQLRALAISGAEAVKTLQEALELLGGPEGGFFGTPTDPNAPAGMLGIPPPLPPPTGHEIWMNALKELKAVGLDALGSLAQGVGNMVHEWVLMGSLAPGAMKKMVASVLAGVAAQCAVLGLMELAYAAAGFTPWGLIQFGPPIAHLKSAAFFFAAAAAAGLMGRAVAGNSFAQGAGAGAGGGGGGGGGTAGGTTTQRGPNIIELERNRPQPIDVNVRVDLHTNDSHIIDSVVSNVHNDGRLRKLIVGMVEG